MTDLADQIFESYFTVGLASHLEPLPSLLYEIVATDDSQKAEDERNAGPGKRLNPRLETYHTQSFETLKRMASNPNVSESVEAWKKLLILLDVADADPHFEGLRQFFDSRSSLQEQNDQWEEEEEDMEILPRSFEHRLSFRAPRSTPRVQWNRRPTVSGGEVSSHPARSMLGSLRRSQRRVTQERKKRQRDMFELWVGPEESKRCVRFNVRLDLHNVHLAPARESPEAAVENHTHHQGSNTLHPLDTFGDIKGSENHEAQEELSPVGSHMSKRSFMHRMLDRGIRKRSNSSGWQHDEHTDYPTHATVESDEEHLDSPSSPQVQMGRRLSAASSIERSQGTSGAKAADLECVVEDSPFEPSEYISTANRTTDVPVGGRHAPHIPFVKEGEDFMHLLRLATSFANGNAWPIGDQDPLPMIVTRAMAEAFGWEGIMHLCYGKDSLCEKEQVFAPLGRAAYLESNRKQKYNAVLSWRNNVVNEDGSVPRPDEEPEHREQASSADVGELSSLPSRSSQDSIHENLGDGPSNARPPARFIYTRTWNDWMLLFSSISSWISEYETTRVCAGLAHEFGQEPIYQNPSCMHLAPLPQAMPPVCVEQDALNSAHGFWRLPGVPGALRSESLQEHMDYRWARTKLHSSQVGTPAVMLLASAQFYFMQLASKPWVHNGSWELMYLNQCIFHSIIAEQRFPPPGHAVALEMPTTGASQAHTIQCPYPSPDGACNPLEWRQWLHSLRDGEIIAPAVSWQGWWVLIAVMNGGDRSGRSYDLQLRAPGDLVENPEPSTVYL